MIDIKLPFVVSEAWECYHCHRMIIIDLCSVASEEKSNRGGKTAPHNMPAAPEMQNKKTQRRTQRAYSASWELPPQRHTGTVMMLSPSIAPIHRADFKNPTRLALKHTELLVFLLDAKKIVKKIKWWQTSSQYWRDKSVCWMRTNSLLKSSITGLDCNWPALLRHLHTEKVFVLTKIAECLKEKKAVRTTVHSHVTDRDDWKQI